MRRFAEINPAGTVLRVIVADSLEWCEETLGGQWVETFKDRSERCHFAGVGFSYDSDLDAFIPPKPYDSWVLDESTCLWVAPVERPGRDYTWNEETGSWDQLPMPEETDEEGNPVPYVWDETAGEWVVSE